MTTSPKQCHGPGGFPDRPVDTSNAWTWYWSLPDRPPLYSWDFGKDERHGQTTWREDGPVILLNYKLGERQQNATLSHELHHLAVGGVCRSFCPMNERKVRKGVARWLLPDLDRLGWELRRKSAGAAAQALDVPIYILFDRLTYATAPERRRLAPVMARAPEWVTGARMTSPLVASAC